MQWPGHPNQSLLESVQTKEMAVPNIPKSAWDAAREVNAQVNYLESRQNLPVVNSRPLNLGLDISDVCNINCIFCVAQSGRKKKSDPEAFRAPEWIEHFEPVLPFVRQAIFSSYEAILNPHLEFFIEYLHRFYTPFQLFSNGLALEPELSAYLLRKGMASLWCSFHGAREKTYQSIMKGSNYDQVLKNLLAIKQYARKNDIPFALTLVYCAMRRTLPELPEFVDLARRVGASAIQVNYLLVTRQDPILERESVFFHQDLYDYYVLKAKLKGAKLGIAVNHQPLFSDAAQAVAAPCYRPWEHLNINKQGKVQICCGGSPVLGNMFEQGFSTLWNSPAVSEFRARVNSDDPPAACRNCTRGREDPKSILSHLTYLRSLPPALRQERLRGLLPQMPDDAAADAACAC